MLKPRVTIKDVARRAGMSLGTVSGVLNGGNGFSEATCQHVWKIARDLDYSPNSQARNLRAGSLPEKRCRSGIIIHISHLGGEDPLESKFQAVRSSLLTWEAEKRGLYPITYWYYRLKGFQCPPVLNGHIDGAIVGTPHVEVVKCLRGQIPLVLMDVPFSGDMIETPMVNLNSRHGFMQLMGLLQRYGHRHIGTLVAAPSGELLLNETVFSGDIHTAARLNGIDIPTEADLTIQVTPETHEEKMAEVATVYASLIRAGKISAIVCPSNSYSESLYRQLSSLGLRIPEDVSLTGLEFELSQPAYDITSISYNWRAIIDTSLTVLQELIERKQTSCREYLVPPDFYPGKTIKNLT